MAFYNIKEHVLPASHIREYPRALANSQEDELVLHVKEYTPKDNPNPKHGDVTLIGGHANGFPKELYEPLWDEVYLQMKKQGLRIRTIYMADVAWQGQSGLLNADKLGNDPSWFDAARDTVHLINTLRPQRPLMAVGHSFGGNILTNVALFHPRLFTSVILLDPVITKFSSNPGPLSESPAVMSTYRRDRWPSREEAARGFKKSPFYKAWDERVLDRWIHYGLKEVENGGKEVELVTTKHQEVFTFLRPSWSGYDPNAVKVFNRAATPDIDTSLAPKYNVYPLYRPEPSLTFSRLQNLRPSVLYLFGGKSNLSPLDLRNEKLEITGVGVGGSGGAKEGLVKGVVHEEAGHLVAQEVPKWCAEEMGPWMKKEMERWWQEEKEWEDWKKKSHQDKVTISEEYKSYVGKPARPRKPKDKEVKAKI